MPHLKELQENFKSHLLKGDGAICADIVSTRELSNIDRLAIYGNAYYARLEEALQGDYEIIHTLLGDEEFSTLCRRYIDSHPSSFYSLRWFGQFMAAFLQDNEPYSQFPYLHELAVFEWRFTDAFDADDKYVVVEADMAHVPLDSWPDLSVALHPSVSWFGYTWNILPVWKAVKENSEIPELQQLDERETCLVWRHGLVTKYRTLEKKESLLMLAADNGSSFSQWCEILVNAGEAEDDVPMMVAMILKTWIGLGMITAITY